MLAPVAVFVYNRPDHTRRMIESLCKNPEISVSPVTVYCDGPKNVTDTKNVNLTRETVRKLLPDAKIIERDNNQGLANSIINGVSEQCDHYGRVIVIEDDLILSPIVLRYFNEALDYYQSYEKVMHISAYMHPVNIKLPSTFFYRETSCWGWATWNRAWKYFKADGKSIADNIFRNRHIKDFNANNSYPFWELLFAQSRGEIDSWAIRWYGSVFLRGGLALSPAESLVQNTGFDGSGTNCRSTNKYVVELSNIMPEFYNDINESSLALHAITELRNKNKISRLHDNIRHYKNIGKYLINKYVR